MFNDIKDGASANGRYEVLVVALGERCIFRRIRMSFRGWWDVRDGNTTFREIGREVFPIAVVVFPEEQNSINDVPSKKQCLV